ncbi:hypothetical protein ANT2_2510 [plant metagenome]|uniref:Uncharacterized protein n=1 Tax=plant metagenome TaxID=1297885 RepID=A0A484SDU6_9ZZZZ
MPPASQYAAHRFSVIDRGLDSHAFAPRKNSRIAVRTRSSKTIIICAGVFPDESRRQSSRRPEPGRPARGPMPRGRHPANSPMECRRCRAY